MHFIFCNLQYEIQNALCNDFLCNLMIEDNVANCNNYQMFRYKIRSPKYIAFRYYIQPHLGAYTILYPNVNISRDVRPSIMRKIRKHGLLYDLFLPHDCEVYSMTACWRKFFEVSDIGEIELDEHKSISTDIYSNGILYRHVVPGIRFGDDGEDIYWNSILTRNQFPFVPFG